MLSIEHVTHRYGSKTVLDGVSLEAPRGSFVSFLGPSGCGKTTMLRIIAGFLFPSAGRVVVDGACLTAPGAVVPPEKRGMGMVFQNYAIWPHMSVYRNVSYGLRLRGLPKNEQRARAMRALEVVDLQDLAERLPSELSGGQQQRVAIARSVATEPNLLLLDEPLSNLDVALRRDLLFDLKRIQQTSGITFVYVTHDQTEALAVSDLVAVFDQGRLRQMAPAREIYNCPSDLFVASFVGNANLLDAVVGPSDTAQTHVMIGKYAALSFACRDRPAAGTACRIAIKRRGVTFHRVNNGEATAYRTGRVTGTFFVGDYDEVAVSMEDQQIFGFAEPNRLRAGDPVLITFDPSSCHLFL